MRVLVFGTFDGLHPGHKFFLSQALHRAHHSYAVPSSALFTRDASGGPGAGQAMRRAVPSGKYARGEFFIVVARDANVRRFKGRLPERTQAQRRREVERAFPEAHVLIGEVDDYFLPVLTVKPDLILLGYDQKLPTGVEERDFREAGIDVERAKPFKPKTYKSSLLRKRHASSLGFRSGLRRTGKRRGKK